MTTTLTVEFLDPDALRAFERAELLHGRAVVRSKEPVELLDDVRLRVMFGELSADLEASVAHPGLPQPDGSIAVGLTVVYDAPAQDAVHALLGDLLDRGWSTTLDLAPSELALANENVARLATGELPAVDGPEGWNDRAGEATDPGRPIAGQRTEGERFDAGTTATGWISEAPAQPKASFPDTVTLSGLDVGPGPEATGTQPAVPDVAFGDLAVETPWSVQAVAPRPHTPAAFDAERLETARGYYESARADLARGNVELARINIDLALAYDPTDAEFRGFLGEIEARMPAR